MLRLMVHTAAAKHDAGEDIRYDAYMCKYLGDTKSFKPLTAACRYTAGWA